MSIVARVDDVLATSIGQTVGWILIFVVVFGVVSQTEFDTAFFITVITLAMSWILGASYGRHQVTDEDDQDEDAE